MADAEDVGDEVLWTAAQCGSASAVRRILHSPSWDPKPLTVRKALYVAIRNDHRDTVAAFVRFHGERTFAQRYPYVMQVAADVRSGAGAATVATLLAARVDVDAVDAEAIPGLTSVHVAVRAGNVHVLRVLVDAKANVNLVSSVREGTALLDATKCRAQCMEIRHALEKENANVDLSHLRRLIVEGCGARSAEMVHMLLAAKAQVNTTWQSGVTPLLAAAANGFDDSVRLLLDAKAAVDAPRKETYPRLLAGPLLIASAKGFSQVVSRLCEAKACLDAGNRKGETPLFAAAHQGHVETARVLVASKADVNGDVGQYGATPLLAASMNGYSKVANFLLSCKADVDKDIAEHRDYVGLDLLMLERQFPHSADTISTAARMRVEGGMTPVCVAARNGQTRIVRLLVQAKCDTGKRVTWYGWTPLHYAAAEGHCEIVRLLCRAACAQADEAPGQEHVAEARSFQQKWAVRGAYKVRAGATFMDVAHTCGVADKVSQALM